MGDKGSNIHSRSIKQKCVSRSSTEAELIALQDAVDHSRQITGIMNELGYKTNITAWQDNMSAIKIIESDRDTERSKHMSIRIASLREQISELGIIIAYLPQSVRRQTIPRIRGKAT
jgi:hypothetical protein